MHLPRILESIKVRIVAVCVLTGLGAALGAGTAVLHATQEELQRQLLDNDRSEGERTASLLSSKLELLKTALAVVAAHVPAGMLQDRAAIGNFLLDKPGLGAMFDSVIAVAPDGTMLARVAHGRLTAEMPNIGDREYFRRAMQGDQPVVSEPLRGLITGAPVVIVAVPVLAGGRTVGVIAGSLRLQSNGLFTDPATRHEAGSREVVMDRKGTLLAHPDPTRILGHAGDEPGLEAVFRRWHDTGSPIDTRASAELSQEHLVSMAGIALSEWVLVRLTPRENALAPMAAARHAAVLSAVVASVVSSLFAGLLAWAISRPIGQLRDRAERMFAAGEASGDAWPDQTGEIGAMSKAFQLLLRAREGQQAQVTALLTQLQAVLDNAEVGIVLTREGRFELVSRQFCRTIGLAREQIVGRPTRLIHPCEAAYEAFSARANPAFLAHGVFDGEVELKRAGGELFWARMRGRAVVPGDRAQGTIWAIVDVTAERKQRDRLNWAANHDLLTGLLNRAAFETLLEESTARAAEEPFCALFIDLDRFKQVNDTGGHAAGDTLLRDIARELTAHLRKSDTVARLGGDEFAVLLPQCPVALAHSRAEVLRAAVQAYRLRWEGHVFSVGASIGLVAVTGVHASAADVLRAADAACYAAKRGGRNQVAMAVAA
ncbi:MAG: diguanylate cyclase [Burkholderiales bacterium]|nr:diguanylate cyclase [Burkholderiales bacterium]